MNAVEFAAGGFSPECGVSREYSVGGTRGMKRIAPGVLVLVILTGMFFAVACGGGSSSSTTAQFRVANVNPFAAGTGYDYLVAGTSFTTGLTFGNVTAYSAVASGSQTIEVRNSGNSNDILNTAETFTGGDNYTLLTIGTQTATSAIFLTDQNTAATSGNFQLRFVNVSTALPNFDVYVVPQSGNCNSYLNGVSADVFGLSFGNNSDYKTFTAGTFQLCITASGTKSAFYLGGNTAYASGAVETIVVDDIGGSIPLQVQTFTDATGS